MNYFEFFNLPEKLEVDLVYLKQQFYQNSKKYHPDFFTLDTSEVQSEALDKSSLNNEAYKTLSNFDTRVKHFLELNGHLGPEGENQIPQDFLMEMMELNEQLMELEFDFENETFETIKSGYLQMNSKLREAINILQDKLSKELTEEDWKLLKDFYLKNQYLRRFATNLEKLKS